MVRWTIEVNKFWSEDPSYLWNNVGDVGEAYALFHLCRGGGLFDYGLVDYSAQQGVGRRIAVPSRHVG